ncbi:hypothetical protein BS78_07G159600 [Paspalum vaginatum]|nr:hypothetical protein BS78_07G159600 [Paspalum vaginatum]
MAACGRRLPLLPGSPRIKPAGRWSKSSCPSPAGDAAAGERAGAFGRFCRGQRRFRASLAWASYRISGKAGGGQRGVSPAVSDGPMHACTASDF